MNGPMYKTAGEGFDLQFTPKGSKFLTSAGLRAMMGSTLNSGPQRNTGMKTVKSVFDNNNS